MRRMKASWAGAMGHTQFLPTDFFKYGVDHGRRWSSRHLEFHPRCARFGCKPATREGLGQGQALGLRGANCPRNVDCSIAEPDTRMPVAEWIKRGYAPLTYKPSRRGIGGTGVAVPAGRAERPCLPDAEEFLRVQGLQFRRSVCAVRRQSFRPDRGRKEFRDSLGQDRAGTASATSRQIQRHLTEAGFYQRQDRWQGRDEDPRGARRLAEGKRHDARLLAFARSGGADAQSQISGV